MTAKHSPDMPGMKKRAGEAYDNARERAVEAYESARDRAGEMRDQAREGISDSPLLALGGGLALGALLAAVLPRTKAENRLLGTTGARINERARAAASAAKDAGQGKLAELNITRDAGVSAVQSLLKGLGDAARSSGEAAISTVRKKD